MTKAAAEQNRLFLAGCSVSSLSCREAALCLDVPVTVCSKGAFPEHRTIPLYPSAACSLRRGWLKPGEITRTHLSSALEMLRTVSHLWGCQKSHSSLQTALLPACLPGFSPQPLSGFGSWGFSPLEFLKSKPWCSRDPGRQGTAPGQQCPAGSI